MEQSKNTSRVMLILAILLIAMFMISPALFIHPGQFFSKNVPWSQKLNLRPGIDMVGGTSLLYEIKPPDGGTPDPDLAERVMEALKKRVDPDGVRNLIWRPQGANRLEIQMPLSGNSGESKKLRETFAKAQAELDATNIRPQQVLDAVEHLTGTARQQKLDQLSQGSPLRAKLFADLTKQWDAQQSAHQRKDAAAEADAEIAYDQLKGQIDLTNLTPSDFQEVLTMGTDARTQRLATLNAQAEGFAARQQAMKNFETAFTSYSSIKSTLDDAEDLKRLLRGSGVLEFHILEEDQNVIAMMNARTSPSPQAGDTSRWVRVDRPEEFAGRYGSGMTKQFNGRLYVLLDMSPDKSLTAHTGAHWALKTAFATRDSGTGDQVCGFEFDAQGAKYFSDLTGANIHKPMAIVLDDKVISAPNINSQIGASGTITGGQGGFSNEDLRYLVSTLNAGSLPARLDDQPISERTVGSSLGADNLRAGLMSCGFGLIVVAVFLISYYYLSGVVAFIAVAMNVLLIIGILAALNATFTLPAIAGIVLSIGTAVDANVLVFERLREEEHRGLGLRLAMRNAYDRAFSAILDSNVTTAITSAMLYLLGSEEIKGFGLTLLIGIACSLFTALFVTRTIFSIMIDKWGIEKFGSLPDTFPKWDKFLKPNINWMGLIWPFIGFSAVSIALGGSLFWHYLQQREVFDIEFASGTAVQFEFKQPTPIEDVRKLIHDADPQEKVIPAPSIVAVGDTGDSYEVVTANPEAPAVRDTILTHLGSQLKLELPSTFGMYSEPFDKADGNVVLPVEQKMAGAPFVPAGIDNFHGGVAIYLNNLSPQLKPSEIKQRIDRMRLMAGQEGAATNREFTVISKDGTDNPTSEAVVLTVDPNVPYEKDAEKWKEEVAGPAWKTVVDSIHKPAALQKVSNFDAGVARDTQTDALMALVLSLFVIMAYIWLRFGNLKYGLATVVALLHDAFFIFAALGFAHWFARVAPGAAGALLIEPFRINLTVVAGILTIMGYSMVDTVVVFDRIREIRGKYGHLSSRVINDAMNQTLSRTLLTCGITVITVSVMYIFGGPGIHAFTFVLMVGILVGTYSSIAIAAPLLLVGANKEARAANPTANQIQRA